MARTLGSKDKVIRRKSRSDRGKKRKRYAGKPVKGKRQKRYDRRVGNKKELKLLPFQLIVKDKKSYAKIPSRFKATINKQNYKPLKGMVIVAPIKKINTKSKVEDFIASRLWEGTFWIKGISNSKNKYHRSWKRMFEIRIKETNEGNVGTITRNFRLSRYKWFYKS